MQQAIDAIKAKYNLSDEEAKKVLAVLIAAEHQRQTGVAPAAGMRGMKRASADARGIDVGDLLGIASSLLASSSGSGGQGNSTSQLLDVVGDLIGSASNQGGGGGSPDLGSVLGSLLGGGGGQAPQQGGGSMDLGSLLGGLLGGASGGGGGMPQQPGQQGGAAPDLIGMLGGLLGSAGAQQGAQGGSADLGGLLNSLLGGGGAAPQQQQPTQQGGGQFYSPQDVQQQAPQGQGGGAQLGQGKPGGKKDYGSIGNAMNKMSGAVQPKASKTKTPGQKGRSGSAPAAKQKK